MDSFFKNVIIYPFLMAIYPILFLYSQNVDQVEFAVIILPLIYSVSASCFLFFFLSFLLKNKTKAGLIVFVLLIFFFSYGRVFPMLRKVFIDTNLFNSHLIFFMVYCFITLILFCLLVATRKELGKLTYIFNIITVILISFLFLNVGTAFINASNQNALEKMYTTDGMSVNTKNEYAYDPPPDIYYIIFDGYASEKTLDQVYDYDNSAFLESLKNRGFFISQNSNSNYPQTFLSLASSLNMQYMNYLTDIYGATSNERRIPYKMIAESEVVCFLKSIGYKHVHFPSNFIGTAYNKNADINFYLQSGNEFINILINTTILQATNKRFLFTREGVEYVFKNIPTVTDFFDEPIFVFAHIIPPHPPYLFGKNGEEVIQSERGEEWNIELYLNQLIFINTKIIELVDSILLETDRPSVIIIQSDHGPGSIIEQSGGFCVTLEHLREGEIAYDGLGERMGILNAIYMPNQNFQEIFYDTVTPVNNFRLIFNIIFNTEFEVIKDKCYFSSYGTPYDFIDVTDILIEK